jgi:hypothetical protein
MKRRRGASSKQRPNSKLTKKKSKACNRTFGSLTLLNKIIKVTFATQHSVRPVLLSERRRGPVSHRRLRRLWAVSLLLAFFWLQGAFRSSSGASRASRRRRHEAHHQGNRRTARSATTASAMKRPAQTGMVETGVWGVYPAASISPIVVRADRERSFLPKRVF